MNQTSEIRVRLAPSPIFNLSSMFLLTVLFWNPLSICVSYLSCCLVGSMQPGGHLLGKG